MQPVQIFVAVMVSVTGMILFVRALLVGLEVIAPGDSALSAGHGLTKPKALITPMLWFRVLIEEIVTILPEFAHVCQDLKESPAIEVSFSVKLFHFLKLTFLFLVSC